MSKFAIECFSNIIEDADKTPNILDGDPEKIAALDGISPNDSVTVTFYDGSQNVGTVSSCGRYVEIINEILINRDIDRIREEINVVASIPLVTLKEITVNKVEAGLKAA